MTTQEWDGIAHAELVATEEWSERTRLERNRIWRDRDAERQLTESGWWGDLPFMGQGSQS